MSPLRVLLAASVLLVASPASASAQFVLCNRIRNGIPTVVMRSHHSISRSINYQTNPWNADVIYAYERSWEGWFYLDTSNLAIWLDGTTANEPWGWWDDNEVIERRNNFGAIGQARSWYWPTDQIEHVDYRIDGPTTTGPPSFSTRVAWTTSCVTADAQPGAQAETGTIMHEFGHGYGYDHFDSFISTMNTGNWDMMSCEAATNPSPFRSMFVQPDPQPTQCHDIAYGIFDGIDLAVNAIRQDPGSTIANFETSEAEGPGSLNATLVTAATPLMSFPIRFTIFNNRDAVSGAVRVGVFLSVANDLVIGTGTDTLLTTFNITGGLAQGEVRRITRTVALDPSTTNMPLTGAAYCLVVRVDDAAAFAETRESNNLTDTRFCFRRTS